MREKINKMIRDKKTMRGEKRKEKKRRKKEKREILTQHQMRYF